MIAKLLGWLFGIHVHDWGMWEVEIEMVSQCRKCKTCGLMQSALIYPPKEEL